jgi:hypothetical protein
LPSPPYLSRERERVKAQHALPAEQESETARLRGTGERVHGARIVEL